MTAEQLAEKMHDAGGKAAHPLLGSLPLSERTPEVRAAWLAAANVALAECGAVAKPTVTFRESWHLGPDGKPDQHVRESGPVATRVYFDLKCSLVVVDAPGHMLTMMPEQADALAAELMNASRKAKPPEPPADACPKCHRPTATACKDGDNPSAFCWAGMPSTMSDPARAEEHVRKRAFDCERAAKEWADLHEAKPPEPTADDRCHTPVPCGECKRPKGDLDRQDPDNSEVCWAGISHPKDHTPGKDPESLVSSVWELWAIEQCNRVRDGKPTERIRSTCPKHNVERWFHMMCGGCVQDAISAWSDRRRPIAAGDVVRCAGEGDDTLTVDVVRGERAFLYRGDRPHGWEDLAKLTRCGVVNDYKPRGTYGTVLPSEPCPRCGKDGAHGVVHDCTVTEKPYFCMSCQSGDHGDCGTNPCQCPDPDCGADGLRKREAAEKEAEKPLEVGDVVRLRSGGPDMTIVRMVVPTLGCVPESAECEWFGMRPNMITQFSLAALVRAKETKYTARPEAP